MPVKTITIFRANGEIEKIDILQKDLLRLRKKKTLARLKPGDRITITDYKCSYPEGAVVTLG